MVKRLARKVSLVWDGVPSIAPGASADRGGQNVAVGGVHVDVVTC